MEGERYEKWFKIGAMIVVVVSLIGVVAEGVSAADCTSNSWWAPDSGEYIFTADVAASGNIKWNENEFGILDAYDHEFRTPVTNFATYDGYWSSNLPWPRNADVDEPEDDFTVYTLYAHGILTSKYYYTYIGLEPEGASSASATVEAERRGWNPFDRIYCNLAVFTAPDQGTWNL